MFQYKCLMWFLNDRFQKENFISEYLEKEILRILIALMENQHHKLWNLLRNLYDCVYVFICVSVGVFCVCILVNILKVTICILFCLHSVCRLGFTNNWTILITKKFIQKNLFTYDITMSYISYIPLSHLLFTTYIYLQHL